MKGAGLLYASNRTTSPEAFLAGIATGDLDAILFPEDPIGKAPQYLAALGRLFPTQKDASVLGISAKFSAFGGALTLDLGVLFDIQASLLARLYVVAQFVGIFPRPRKGEKVDASEQAGPHLRRRRRGLGHQDRRAQPAHRPAQLAHLGGRATGGASLFHGSPQADGGNRGIYILIGGFHPDYVPPGTKICLLRLALALKKGDHLKLEVRGYVAYTPSSVQFGLAGKIEARLYGFGIRGLLSFDVLMGFDGNCNIKIEVQRRASGRLPLDRGGAVRRHAFGTSSHRALRQGLGEVPLLDVLGPRHAHDPRGRRRARAGRGRDGHARLRHLRAVQLGVGRRSRADAHRQQERRGLALAERALDPAPAGRSFERPHRALRGARLGAPQTLRIEKVAADAAALSTTPVSGEFALGMFLDLTQEEMLASRGFESRDGQQITRPLEMGAAVDASDIFEEILLDPKQRPDTVGASARLRGDVGLRGGGGETGGAPDAARAFHRRGRGAPGSGRRHDLLRSARRGSVRRARRAGIGGRG